MFFGHLTTPNGIYKDTAPLIPAALLLCSPAFLLFLHSHSFILSCSSLFPAFPLHSQLFSSPKSVFVLVFVNVFEIRVPMIPEVERERAAGRSAAEAEEGVANLIDNPFSQPKDIILDMFNTIPLHVIHFLLQIDVSMCVHECVCVFVCVFVVWLVGVSVRV